MTAPAEAAGGPTTAGASHPQEQKPAGPLAESVSQKEKILSMLNEDTKISDLFNMEKAQKNIYEIETKITEILNQ